MKNLLKYGLAVLAMIASTGLLWAEESGAKYNTRTYSIAISPTNDSLGQY